MVGNDDSNMATPEQKAAIALMEENLPPLDIFKEVAASIPQTIPDGIDKDSWKYGSVRVVGRIAGRNRWEF